MDENKGQIILYQTEDSKVNLEVIIAVGFRVRSKQGTLFRQWAI